MYVNFNQNLSLFNGYADYGGSGAIIRIDNTTQGLVDHSWDGMRVEAGSQTLLGIGREFKSSLPQPYSQCQTSMNNPSELYDKISKSSYTYTQEFCVRQCLQRLAIKTCNCSISALASVFTATSCTTTKQNQCVFLDAYSNIFSKNNYVVETCLPECPLECDSTRFTYTYSANALLGDGYSDYINSNGFLSSDFDSRPVTVTQAAQSVTGVRVFYESLAYTTYDESPQWTLVSLLASLGGNWGLYLGVSLFSLCEIGTTFFELYFLLMKKKKQQNNVSEENTRVMKFLS
jgi:hypothetical protein